MDRWLSLGVFDAVHADDTEKVTGGEVPATAAGLRSCAADAAHNPVHPTETATQRTARWNDCWDRPLGREPAATGQQPAERPSPDAGDYPSYSET
ncbi:hypothetical protein [Halovenus halobia]|uniref:hypothetical protein n=1 Tax=Halovenus halobia TaxID=3396622 RepID=UPI003F5644C0